MKTTLLTLIILAFVANSCHKDVDVTLSKKDYLMFGRYINNCQNNDTCVEIFKLFEKELYEDHSDLSPYGSGFYSGSFSQTIPADFIISNDLMTFFPTDLIADTLTEFGHPSTSVDGGIYIEYKVNKVRKMWQFDLTTDSIPANYREFISKVAEKITLMK